MLEKLWRISNPHSLLVGDVNRYSHRRKWYRSFSKNWEQSYDMTQQSLFWASTRKIWKHLFAKIYACRSPRVHCSLVSKAWKQVKCPSIDDWIKNMWHTQGGTPKNRNLFIKNCVFTFTWLNFSHFLSSLYLMQYTYFFPLLKTVFEFVDFDAF